MALCVARSARKAAQPSCWLDGTTKHATARLPMETIYRLIEQEAYFVLHAPRQTGKTTAMIELASELTASGGYVSAMVSMEVGAAFLDDIDGAEEAMLADWSSSIRYDLPENLQLPSWSDAKAGQSIQAALES